MASNDQVPEMSEWVREITKRRAINRAQHPAFNMQAQSLYEWHEFNYDVEKQLFTCKTPISVDMTVGIISIRGKRDTVVFHYQARQSLESASTPNFYFQYKSECGSYRARLPIK